MIAHFEHARKFFLLPSFVSELNPCFSKKFYVFSSTDCKKNEWQFQELILSSGILLCRGLNYDGEENRDDLVAACDTLAIEASEVFVNPFLLGTKNKELRIF